MARQMTGMSPPSPTADSRPLVDSLRSTNGTMADDFVQNFLSIPDPVERLKALHRLVHSVSYDERQVASALIYERNDIVPRLPLELVLDIFSYLQPHDVWVLQPVNRRWRRMLSSERVQRAALARWDSHDFVADSGRSPELLAQDSISDKIRHMQAIRHGKPFTHTTLDNTGTGLQDAQPRLPHRRLDLSRDKIAYISSQHGEGDTVVIRNLVTGAASMLRGEAREKIMSVVLTNAVVAFVTFEGCLYVAEHSDHLFLGPTSQIQLPSSRVRAVAGHGRSIALAIGAGGVDSAYVTSVLLYDAATQRLQGFPVGPTQKALEGRMQKLNSCALIVDSNRKTIDIFNLMYTYDLEATTGRTNVTFCRISFSGHVQSSNIRSHFPEHKIAVDYTHLTMAPPQPIGYKGKYRIQIGHPSSRGALPIHPVFAFTFDTKNSSFVEPHADPRYYRLSTFRDGVCRTEPKDKNMNVAWKDVVFSVGLRENSDWQGYVAMMNDTFLVSLELSKESAKRSRIRILCFDEKAGLSGGRDYGLWT